MSELEIAPGRFYIEQLPHLYNFDSQMPVHCANWYGNQGICHTVSVHQEVLQGLSSLPTWFEQFIQASICLIVHQQNQAHTALKYASKPVSTRKSRYQNSREKQPGSNQYILQESSGPIPGDSTIWKCVIYQQLAITISWREQVWKRRSY